MQMYRQDAQASLASWRWDRGARGRSFSSCCQFGGGPGTSDPALRHETRPRNDRRGQRRMRGQVDSVARAGRGDLGGSPRPPVTTTWWRRRCVEPDSASFLRAQPLTVAEIRQVLDDRTVLPNTLEPSAAVWAVAREGEVTTCRRHRNQAMARRWHDLLSAGPEAGAANGDEARSRQIALSRDAHCAGRASWHRRLLIVADGTLQYIPAAPGSPTGDAARWSSIMKS